MTGPVLALKNTCRTSRTRVPSHASEGEPITGVSNDMHSSSKCVENAT